MRRLSRFEMGCTGGALSSRSMAMAGDSCGDGLIAISSNIMFSNS